ncbi:hypothetical protein NPIL_353791, partial [Nephila pilipes]
MDYEGEKKDEEWQKNSKLKDGKYNRQG